ncbi:MAG: RNA-binding S4 domain-containing protein [Tissierellales bacterium]
MQEVSINTEFIKLDQFLKYVGVAGTGGHSKDMIKNGEVKVNGEIALERGKKIRVGNIVEIAGEGSYIVK